MKFLNTWSNSDFTAHLNEFRLIEKGEEVTRIRVAGEGNMNFTFRISLSSGKTLIAKQSPPFCAKYPQIPAPEERILSEKKYFEVVGLNATLRKFSPKVLGFDASEAVLYLQDLGEASDFDCLYESQLLSVDEGMMLVDYLSELHELPVQELQFKNQAMRELNHDYIFTLPFQDPQPFDLNQITPGLDAASLFVRGNLEFQKIARVLGQAYLHDGSVLIHGDFYPRSWIKTRNGLFVIDSEFAHIGTREFDLGVFLGHLMMCGQIEVGNSLLKKQYRNYSKVDPTLLARYTAIEVLRRLLYVAQIPVKNSLSFKVRLMEMALDTFMTGNLNSLQ